MSRFSPEETETIRLIDRRQSQLLEDLDALNLRIVLLLKDHGVACADGWEKTSLSTASEDAGPDSSALDPAA